LFAALLSQDVSQIEDILCDWLDETISYHNKKEQYYHGFLAGLLTGYNGYSRKSNRESGNGRYDSSLLERRRRELALAQIEEKRYEYEHPGNIILGCCCKYGYKGNRHHTLRYSACSVSSED